MKHADNVEAVVAEIRRMAATVAEVDLGTPVPTCPGWDIRELIAHTGGVHRWATAMVTTRSPEPMSRKSMEMDFPTDDGWSAWLADGAAPMGAAFAGTSGDEPMWAWASEPRVRFWSRRQLHETVVHHADACFALGVEPTVSPEIAIDGVQEALDLGLWKVAGAGETVHLHATDGDGSGEWMITLTDGRPQATHGHGKGDVAIRGRAADLLWLNMRRLPLDDARFEVFGDRALADRWIAGVDF